MKTMYLEGLGDVPVVDENEWMTICYFLEVGAPTFDPSENDLNNYEYRIRPDNRGAKKSFQLQRRKK